MWLGSPRSARVITVTIILALIASTTALVAPRFAASAQAAGLAVTAQALPAKYTLDNKVPIAIPMHGNWCGVGYGGGYPTDALDELCRQHDKCYERRGFLKCDCDKIFARNVQKQFGTMSLSHKTKAITMAIYFLKSPCFRQK